MDDSMFQIIAESFQEGISQCIMESSVAFSDAEMAITEAMEVYETSILVGSYETVTESAGKEHLSAVCEAAGEGFFSKIANAFKALISKIKEIGGKLMDKLKKFGAWVKSKVKAGNKKIFGIKKWPNGFTLNLDKGVDELSSFAKEAGDISLDMSSKFVDLATIVTKNNEEELKKWGENNKDILDGGSPWKMLNDKLKIKFSEEGGESGVQSWVEAIFGYEKMGEDYTLTVGDVTKSVRMLLDYNSLTAPLLKACHDTITEVASSSQEAAGAVESAGKQAGDPGKAKLLHQLSNIMIRFAEFQISTSMKSCQFAVSKYNEMVHVFAQWGYIRLAD